MRIEAFAKINWSLDIVGIRPDGYHMMDMVMQPVSLSDEILLSPSGSLSITTGGYPRSRADETNLAMRAARALQSAAGCRNGASIHVHKRIPIGAGMGGGSADAAAVLLGLNRLWNIGFSPEKLEQIGLTLGADVPFCLRGGLARTTGIGENMESIPCKSNFRLLVFQPCRGLSTRDIFALWSPDTGYRPDTLRVIDALSAGDLDLLDRSIGNVLEPVSALICPEIRQATDALRTEGAKAVSMTGSGSAVFGVFRSEGEALKARESLSRRWPHIHLCHTQSDSIRIAEE